MRLQIAIPEEHVQKDVLDGALEAVTRLNESMLKAGHTPTDKQLIAQGARWQPEPPGQEHFDHGAKIEERGWGDCDDWAPLRAARLRVTGEDPGATAVVRKTGAKRWHATVIRSAESRTLPPGTEDDPSLDAGMPGRGSVHGARAATVPLMFSPGVHGVGEVGSFINMPQLALRPITRDGQVEAWESRADLPWHAEPGDSPQDVAMVALHRSPVSSQAVVGAARGAFRMGCITGADPEQLKRLSALAEACEGRPWEEIAADYGEEHANAAAQLVGGFFGKALKKLGKVAKGIAKPLAKSALSFVPGGGLVTTAFNAASPLLKKSVLKQKHVPPQERQPATPLLRKAPRAADPRAAAAAPGAAPGAAQWLPYPYPLPYPVPCWPGAASESTPGQAWPPRGA